MKKINKAVAFDVNSFVEETLKNTRPASIGQGVAQGEEYEDKEEDSVLHPVAEVKEVETESLPEKGSDAAVTEVKAGKGRPKKKRILERNTQRLVRLDTKLSREMGMIKLMHNIDIQDLIYVAVDRFCRVYFPEGQATEEGLKIVRDTMKLVNGED